MIKGFDSWEKFYADTREAENVANYSLTDEQKNLTYGDYYLTVQQDLLIIGYILPQEEVSPSMPPKDPEAKAEWEYEKELMEDSYSRGYRFGKAYSVVCPEGELGDKHVADIIMKISKADFEILKTSGWNLDEAYQLDPGWGEEFETKLHKISAKSCEKNISSDEMEI